MRPPFDPLHGLAVTADVSIAAHSSSAALKSRQNKRLTELLVIAKQKSKLFRELLKDIDPDTACIEDLPITHKNDLMAQFSNWVTDPDLHLAPLQDFVADAKLIAQPYLDRYMVWESSGSTGASGIFVQDAKALAVYDALEFQRRPALRPWQRWCDPFYLNERFVFIGAIDGHFASVVSIKRLQQLNPGLSGNLHCLSFLQPTQQLVAQLQAIAPTIISTYPSVAVLLAEESRAGRLTIRPQEIWTGGETFSPPMRHFVQEAFACHVADSYGASEFLPIAAECQYGHLHLNSDWVILESVDLQGRVMPADITGATTLLTNLANHLQPLIRYDIGDHVTLHSASCECGSPLPLIEVQGRNDETLRLGKPGAQQVQILPLALSTILEHEAGLYDFQLIQKGPCELLLCTEQNGRAVTHSLQRAKLMLTNYLNLQGVVDVQIHCHSGASIYRGRSGKVQRVIAMTSSKTKL